MSDLCFARFSAKAANSTELPDGSGERGNRVLTYDSGRPKRRDSGSNARRSGTPGPHICNDPAVNHTTASISFFRPFRGTALEMSGCVKEPRTRQRESASISGEKGNAEMATGSSQHHTTAGVQDGLVARAATYLRQRMCGLHGHDSLLHFEDGRMSLLCSSCGYESPGWELKGSIRSQAAQGLPERLGDVPVKRPRIVRLPLVGERRVA